jgi:uncharacterized membrane protein
MSVLSMARTWPFPRFSISAIAAVTVGVLMAAGAVHIGAILLVPVFAEADGWSRIAPYAGTDRFTEVPVSPSGGVAGLDPLFVNGACRIDLTDAPAGITVNARDRFWSVALYNPDDVIVFSLNDRTAIEGSLDMIVVNPSQNAELQRAATEDITLSIVAESPSDDLIAVLRLFAPTKTAQEDARRIMAQAECLPAPSVMPARTSGG